MISFWERDYYFNKVDFVIVGGGFTGYFTALQLKKKSPSARILLLERSALGRGASTRNAGFACFGSVGELLDDLKNDESETVFKRVERRFLGLQKFREFIPDQFCDYIETGGTELFKTDELNWFEQCAENIEWLNKALKQHLGFSPYAIIDHKAFGFNNVGGAISIQREGYLHPVKALHYLHKSAVEQGIRCLHGVHVNAYEAKANQVTLNTDLGIITCGKVIFATNAFTSNLLPTADVVPARGQVLITNELEQVPFKRTFHIDQGYCYFRNVGKRVLLGGGRNLQIEQETNSELELNADIQHYLTKLLNEIILPNTKHSIDQRWSGIMGFGEKGDKEPQVKEIEPNVFAAYRLGGMGVALSAQVGQEAASLALD